MMSKAQRKFDVVMEEFATGKLRSSSGEKVRNKDQALAIAYSEARTIDPGYGKETVLTGKQPRRRRRKV